MRLKLLFLLFLFLLSFNTTYAVSFSTSSGVRNCAGTPSINDSSGKKWIPVSNNLNAPSSGSFTCEEHGYWSGSWSTWRNQSGNFSCPNNGYASQIQCRDAGGTIRPCNVNGNGWTQYRVYCKLRDDTPPTLANITISPANNAYLIADDTRTVQINVAVAGGSPTASIRTQMERFNNPTAFQPVNQNNTNNFSHSFNLSRVDGTDRSSNNYRPYTFQVTEVCDEAGNCMSSVPVTYTYNVYADGYNSGNSTVSFPNNITNGTSYADASNKTITLNLRDQYNNTIVPVRNASDGLLRSIGFVFNHTAHSLRINQYDSTSTAGAVQFEYAGTVRTPNVGVASSSFSETNVTRNTGNYTLQTRVYAPTQNVYPQGDGNFTLSSLALSLTGMANVDMVINRVFSFRPIYTTTFNGELLANGFIEGATQSGSIQITRNSNPTITNPRLYLEFGSGASNQPSPEYNLDFGQTNPTLRAVEGNQGTVSNLVHVLQNLGANQVINLKTLLTQNSGTSVGGLASSYLSSHIQYTLGGRLVQYNADVIGKDNYFGGNTSSGNTVQEGIKILGLSSSDKNQELTSGQFASDVRIIGKLVKSTFRKDISQKVYTLINSLTSVTSGNQRVIDFTGTSWSSSINNTGVRISENKALVFKDMGGDYVELGDRVGSTTVTGVKTIVVTGGDIYITENIINNTSQTSLLGIIALKDENGFGGNIYVDPIVTDIHAVLYAEKTLMSARDINTDRHISQTEIHNQNTPIATLANQLYIKGSLFSENTIGGSRSSPVECPYYVVCTTSNEAQPYDLNFLRRYVRIDTDGNTTLDSVANGGTQSSGTNSTTQDYPVVIEYNSQLQITPPLFFD